MKLKVKDPPFFIILSKSDSHLGFVFIILILLISPLICLFMVSKYAFLQKDFDPEGYVVLLYFTSPEAFLYLL